MARVLVTGMSGAGKTTLLRALAARGHLTVDTDYDGWVQDDGRWDEPRMAALLAGNRTVVVSGTVADQGSFYDRFEHVVLLSAPLEVLLERVRTRTDNPYGRAPGQEREIRQNLRDVEPLLRRGGDPRARRPAPGRRPGRRRGGPAQALRAPAHGTTVAHGARVRLHRAFAGVETTLLGVGPSCPGERQR